MFRLCAQRWPKPHLFIHSINLKVAYVRQQSLGSQSCCFVYDKRIYLSDKIHVVKKWGERMNELHVILGPLCRPNSTKWNNEQVNS